MWIGTAVMQNAYIDTHMNTKAFRLKLHRYSNLNFKFQYVS